MKKRLPRPALVERQRERRIVRLDHQGPAGSQAVRGGLDRPCLLLRIEQHRQRPADAVDEAVLALVGPVPQVAEDRGHRVPDGRGNRSVADHGGHRTVGGHRFGQHGEHLR